MKWTPDTHQISFEIENGRVVSFSSSDDKYVGRDVQEVYEEVVNEHVVVNGSGRKEELDNNGISLDSLLSELNYGI